MILILIVLFFAIFKVDINSIRFLALIYIVISFTISLARGTMSTIKEKFGSFIMFFYF